MTDKATQGPQWRRMWENVKKKKRKCKLHAGWGESYAAMLVGLG